MKGNESKKEKKKEKKVSETTKVQSDYQREKGRKSVADPIVFKPKK